MVNGFPHFLSAELVNLPHELAVFMREVSDTGDDSIFAIRIISSEIVGSTSVTVHHPLLCKKRICLNNECSVFTADSNKALL